jgi:hypothetical protein
MGLVDAERIGAKLGRLFDTDEQIRGVLGQWLPRSVSVFALAAASVQNQRHGDLHCAWRHE